ncbi:hypothetical protein AB0E67_23370 [Streptomyces sp. NPDC032161]|uniref:hypothetical protein n=1 Tax=unclassified Streptomyces TaxID=2593676 RepID=UPI0034099043
MPQHSPCVGAPKRPAQSLPAAPVIVVVVVLGLFTGLTATGMPIETAATTVGLGGLLGIELVRRLVQALPPAGLAEDRGWGARRAPVPTRH